MKTFNKEKFLTKKWVVFLGALICCSLWGSAFPGVKTGMALFQISSADFNDQILFAGMRFLLAGIFIVIIGSILSGHLLVPKGIQYKKIVILSAFQTVGQYVFYYIGLANCTGVNASIVNSLGNFISILFAALIFRMEKISSRKMLGCVLGFLGVILINTGGSGLSLNMTFLGEGFIFFSCISYALSSVFIKIYSKDDNPVLLSGYQFAFGGLVLIIAGLASGGRVHNFNADCATILIYLALVSTIAYTLWAILLKYNDVSKVAIFGFLTPVFGVLLSVLVLDEGSAFSVSSLLALIAVCTGIAIVNSKQK